MSQVKQLPNGINTFVNQNNQTLHQCMYCEIWFLPKRRFMQKFCSESCRVLACRHRKKDLFGLKGGELKERNKTTNTSLKNELKELREQIKENNKQSKEITFENKESISNEMHEVKINLLNIQIKQNEIVKLQKWQMFISVVIPLISPKLIEIIKNIFSSDKPVESLNEFEKKVEPLLKDLPEDLKDKLFNSAKNYYSTYKSTNL